MTVDERVRTALVEIADDVRPQPDPYGRLHVRRRRVRRRRRAMAGAGLALVAVVAATLPLLPGRGGPTVDDTDATRTIHQWAEQLRKSPVRGAFGAANPAYVAELAQLVAEHQRAGAFRVKAPVTEVNVLYLDDVGGGRVAFVAFHLATPDPTTKWENASAWFVATPDASAAELADPESTAGIGDGLDPFSVMAGLERLDGSASAKLALAIAPAGCVVETAPLPGLDVWTPEPTGSYLVRTPDTTRPEWWRVVCAGVVKDARPASPLPPGPTLTEKQLDTALRGARGEVDQQAARQALQTSAWKDYGLETGPARVVWGGEVAGARADVNVSFNGDAVVTATPWVRDRWSVNVEIHYQETGPGGTVGTGIQQLMPDDPSDPAAVLPIRLGQGGSVLVIVPDDATTVRAVRAGTLVDTATVTGLAAVVDAPEAPDLTFEALDRDGTVLASAKLPPEPPVDLGLDIVPW
jgi:hypothetical protein